MIKSGLWDSSWKRCMNTEKLDIDSELRKQKNKTRSDNFF